MQYGDGADDQVEVRPSQPRPQIPDISSGLHAWMSGHSAMGQDPVRLGVDGVALAPLFELYHDRPQRPVLPSTEHESVNALAVALERVLEPDPELAKPRAHQRVQQRRPALRPAPLLRVARSIPMQLPKPPRAASQELARRPFDQARSVPDRPPMDVHGHRSSRASRLPRSGRTSPSPQRHACSSTGRLAPET